MFNVFDWPLRMRGLCLAVFISLLTGCQAVDKALYRTLCNPIFCPVVKIEQVLPSGAALRHVPTTTRLRDGRRVAILLEDWFYCDPQSDLVYKVPRGFETDFPSIPTRLLRAVFDDKRAEEAALLHDYLYAVGTPGDDEGRGIADELFRNILEESNVSFPRRKAMYRAVQAFRLVEGKNSPYGRSSEWDNFADPMTTLPACAPFEKPHSAVVGRSQCKKWAEDRTNDWSSEDAIAYALKETSHYVTNIDPKPRNQSNSCASVNEL
ncbi:MAG: DUF1353 domain-containing protein [Pseudomonadota bacterium]